MSKTSDDDTREAYDGDHLYNGIEFSCSDAPAPPIERLLKSGSATTEWLQEVPTGDCPALKLICRQVRPDELQAGFTADAPIPFSKSTLDLATWPLRDYEVLWRAPPGGCAALKSEPRRFLLQTPDDGGPFCSFALKAKGIYVKGVYYYSHESYAPTEVLKDALIVSGWRRGGAQIISLPVSFLKVHVAGTARELALLSKRVTYIENIVSEPRGMHDNTVDYGYISLKLHACSATLIRLERRALFEKNLVTAIEEFVAALQATDRINGYVEMNGSRLQLQKSMMAAAAHEFESLPKRIENQRTLIFNLIVQRDQRLNLSINRANMEIAENARHIAEATMADSAAMKTIAILTMVFLPGTAVASFFSMTMFNWEGTPGEPVASSYIWVFFVTSIPLTMAVMAIWLVCHRRRKKNIKRSNTLRSLDFAIEAGEQTQASSVLVELEDMEREGEGRQGSGEEGAKGGHRSPV